MPPDAPTAAPPATDAGPAANGAASPPAAAPKERGPALIRKHVEAHEKARAEEAAKELAAADDGKGTPGRDPETGKFLPAGAKPKPAKPKAKAEPSLRADAGPAGAHNPGEPGATPGPATEEPADDKPGPSADSKARRLVREGKIAEAMKTIGLDPSRLESPKWAAWRKHNEKVAAGIAQAQDQVARERAEVQETARGLVQSLQPFIQARQAFEKEDYEEAFRLAFGTDLNSFQRRALQKMANPGAGADPAVVALRKELADLRAERQQEREQMTQAQREADRQNRIREMWGANVAALADSGDPRMEKLSRNGKFMRMVWDIQAENYDRDTDSTSTPLEAAELALERLEAERAEFSEVFGGAPASSDEHATRTRNPAATGPSGTSARRTARAVTTLNPSEAAEAAPATKLKGKALIEYYAKKALADQVRANGV